MRKAPIHATFVLGLLLGILLGIPSWVSAQTTREIRVPIEDGRVSILSLTRELLNEYGFSGDHLHFSDVRVDVRGVKGQLLLTGLSKSLLDTTRFRKVDEGKTLLLRVDSARARVVRQRVKRRFGRILSAIVGQDVLARHYHLDVPKGLAADEAFVLCVHGVDSSARVFGDLRRFLAAGDAPIRSGTFEYANDESVDRIGEELAKRLKQRARQFPKQRIILVAHSMGGLVARHMLETPALDPGTVPVVILLGVPNRGSRLARMRPGIDLLEFFRDQGDKPRALAPLFDGMGEAGWDLWPGSPFLTALNRKPRNKAVRYHLILGDRGVVSGEQLGGWRRQILKTVQRVKHSEVYEKKIDAWLSDLDELVAGRGDGAVSVARGKLDGVPEVVVPLLHNQLLQAARNGGEQPVFAKIREWIAAAREPR